MQPVKEQADAVRRAAELRLAWDFYGHRLKL
jgi:hypothetical protein